MSNRSLAIAATLAAALLLPGSRAGAQQVPAVPAVPPVAPASPDAPAAPAFTPPENGRLTAAQVRMFIEVRRATTAATQRSSGDVQAQFNALTRSFEEEARATAALGVSIDEYRWVSARVMEAMPEAATGPDAILSAITAALRDNPAFADAGAAQALGIKPQPPAALAYNRQLLSKFQTELRAVLPR
ncbi:MAG TPA: hypothetical protein VH417_02595 [Vicinamibacterales bacterium]|jgi:hypothetical protein